MSKLPELNQHCGNCRFRSANDVAIECHRYAPKPKMEAELPDDRSGAFSFVVWPELSSQDWCGEWEPEK